jgi:hypothetical protein
MELIHMWFASFLFLLSASSYLWFLIVWTCLGLVLFVMNLTGNPLTFPYLGIISFPRFGQFSAIISLLLFPSSLIRITWIFFSRMGLVAQSTSTWSAKQRFYWAGSVLGMRQSQVLTLFSSFHMENISLSMLYCLGWERVT